MPEVVVFGISFGFPKLSRCDGQIAHVLLTRSPLVYSRRSLTARLACVKHAASVRPEPGSNSPLKSTDVPPKQDSSTHGASRQEWPRANPEPVLPKEPSTNTKNQTEVQPSQPADGALQINSSTFGTLLSSQGSSAHPDTTSRPCPRGNLVKLTGPLTAPRQRGPACPVPQRRAQPGGDSIGFTARPYRSD